MAVAYAGTIKNNLQRAIEYILNEAKTNGLTYAHECSEDFAPWEFKEVHEEFPNNLRKNLARSWMISFADWEKDVTPELVMKFAKEFMNEIYGDDFQYVIAVHQDQSHLHAHIIYNNVSYITGKSPNVEKNFIFKAKEKSDEICKKYGLSVIIKDKKNKNISDDKFFVEKKGKIYSKAYKTNYSKTKGEKYAQDRGKSFKQTIKSVIDFAIKNSKNYDDFKTFLSNNNIEIKEGKHIAFKVSGQKRFVRGYTLDNKSKNKERSKYTRDAIINRIDKNIEKINSKNFKKVKSKIINLSKNQKAIDSKAYKSWALKNNIENISETFIKMDEYNVRNINDINLRLDEINSLKNDYVVKIDLMASNLNAMEDALKKLITINKFSKIYNQYEANGTQKFYEKYHKEIEAYKKAYQSIDDKYKGENIHKLYENIEVLKTSINKSNQDYEDNLKKEDDLKIIKANLEDFLEIDKDINLTTDKTIEL